jgi:PAS domain S-box-containing protein
MEDGAYIVNQQYDIQYVNPFLVKDFGPYEGIKCYRYFHDRDDVCPWCKSQDVWAGKTVRWEWYSFKNDRTYDLMDTPLTLPDGSIGKLEIFRDITERKRAEKALQESEKKYRTLLETTSEGYWIIDPELKTIEVNQAFCNMLGYSQDEILGKTPFEFVDDENRKILIEQNSKIPTTSHRSYEITLKKKNGEDLYTHFNASTIRDESGDIQGAFALITDITERKQTQEERDRLAIAIEQSAESVFITDRDGIIQYINPAFERLTGYSRKDAIGQNPRILKSGKHDALFYKEMWDTLIRGDAWHGRFINKKKDSSFYEADATISPVSDSSGKITNFVSIKRDVTHEIELEKQLIQSQKMEAIGTLAGGIAHDFNNILAAIMGYAGLALIEVPKETRLYDDVQGILHASHRAKDLVQQILTFSRKSEEEKAPVQIRHLVKEALKFLRSSLPTTIEIREEIAGETGIVNANPTQMHQVIMNLCTNASHAMQGRGILEVGLRNVDFDSHSAARYPDIDPGTYLRLTVSDTGEGMTPDVKKRIFEPYFTTKEKGVGTGMGLSVVHGIVKSHEGTITVYSEPGKGSTFHVYIPLIQEEVKSPEIDKDAPIPTGTEHILFIDDEPALVDMGKQIFERLGYEVTSRTSGVEALELFKAQPDRFDLVITDMTMPNMMGDKLARELMKIRPDIPIIICTGYSERITEEKAKRIGIKAFVMKPLVMKYLANTVRKVLDRN